MVLLQLHQVIYILTKHKHKQYYINKVPVKAGIEFVVNVDTNYYTIYNIIDL